jgi:hypothetical protein
MSAYTVTAKRWEHGWEPHIDDVGVTQSPTLDGADQVVRDYLEALTNEDASTAKIEIRPNADG